MLEVLVRFMQAAGRTAVRLVTVPVGADPFAAFAHPFAGLIPLDALDVDRGGPTEVLR